MAMTRVVLEICLLLEILMKENHDLYRPQTTRSVKSGNKHGTEDSFAKIATPAAFTEAASGQARIKIICRSCFTQEMMLSKVNF